MKKILILSANPKKTSQLHLDEEVRAIQTGLERAKKREQFEVITKWAVQVDDLRRALLDYEPQIVHFSGHGAGNDGLVLVNNSGELQLVSTQSLARLFKLFKDKVECVLLNTCYSELQAEAIHQNIDYVIGMNRAVGDRAAIKFAVGFSTQQKIYSECCESFGVFNYNLFGECVGWKSEKGWHTYVDYPVPTPKGHFPKPPQLFNRKNTLKGCFSLPLAISFIFSIFLLLFKQPVIVLALTLIIGFLIALFSFIIHTSNYLEGLEWMISLTSKLEECEHYLNNE